MGADLNPTMFGVPTGRHPRPRRPRPARAATPQIPAFDAVAPEGTRVLGIDLGLKLGWAVLDHAGLRLDSGVLRLDRYPNVWTRAYQAGNRLSGLVRNAAATAVAYELVRRHEGVDAAHVYGGLQWTLLSLFGNGAKVQPETVEVAAVKMAATGKGNADKASMLAAARTKWGDDIGDDNEADALWVAEVLRRRVAVR